MATSKKSLSQPQIEALLEGVHHKLVRAAADWIYSEKVKKSDTVSLLIVKRFRLRTIKSLYRRGLMSANNDDPRLHDGHYGDECLIWLRDGDHPARPLVWTSSLGRELLSEMGLLSKNVVDNVIPFPIAETTIRRPAQLKEGAGIVERGARPHNLNLAVDRIVSSRTTGQPCEHRYEGLDIVLEDEELRQFHGWLQSKGDGPNVVLACKWIAEFELYAEEDAEELREVNALIQLRAKHDPEAKVALKVIRWVEETVEPEPMLKRLHDWLLAKGNDPIAVLARWWLAEFEGTQQEDRPYSRSKPTLH